MTTKFTKNLDIQTAEQTRDFAKQKITEVQSAQENYLKAITQAQDMFFNSGVMKNDPNAAELNKKAIDFTKNNLASGYDLVKSLVDATDITQAIEIQKGFVQKQMEAYSTQAKELTQLASKTAKK